MRFKLVLLLIAFAFSLNAVIISGFVKEKDTEEPLPYASVIIKGKISGITDENGFFSFRVEDDDSFVVVVLYAGYEKYTKVLKGKKKFFINVFLDKRYYTIEESSVKGTRKSMEKPQTSTTITSASFRNIPSFIEQDITSVIATLPGVVKRNDFSSALYVMGGKPDQNLLLLDNAVVYSPYHLGGIFSTFNTYAIKSVNLLSGNFPAEYGNRVSAVMVLTTKDGRKDKISAGGEISLVSTKLFMEGPINDKLTFFLGARRTYLDFMIENAIRVYNVFATNKSDFLFPYYFYDFNCAVSYKPDINTRIKFSAMTGSDILHFDEDTSSFDMRWVNTVFNLSFYKLIGDNRFLEGNLAYSYYNNRFDIFSMFYSDNKIKTPVLFLQYSDKIGSTKYSLFGEIKDIHFTYGTEIKVDTSMSDEYTANPLILSTGGKLLINFIPNVFNVKPSLRINYYTNRHEYSYSPRLESSYSFNENSILFASIGKYYQDISTLKREGNVFSDFLGDLWFAIGSDYPLTSAITFTTGIKYWIKGIYPLSVQYYYRKMYNVYSFTGETNDPNILKSEDGISTGLMTMIQKKNGKWSGWVSYTFSITVMNDTMWYYPEHDLRHSFHLFGSYNFTDNFNMGLHISFASGLPYTGPIADYINYTEYYDFINGEYINEDDMYHTPISIIESDHNQMRLPWYNRVDLNITYSIILGKFKGGIFLNIINLFNEPNPIFYYYDTFQNPPQRHSFYLPIIPSIGIRGTI